ncbi:glycosyltransferase family 2 protein [Clostridium sp. CF012]|uniref:glycosyltransferase family 2 protein n=1 Tax=Clostridium sp. CF012 TaxID=2843319 RepID=UPI001C0B236C|nr:glycosyltransferase family 2 protein [Clostridium sp. CF012]MBU3142617.1 glycosyltransferase family 2 protein [Clostridium sp. CF012]
MKLSIIIPTYNVEKFIKTTINSLLVQSQKDFEIVIVDDGSTDNTLKIIEEVIKDSKLNNCILIKQTNGGVSSARNSGIHGASGKYIMFLDGDDYVDIDLIKNIYENIDKSESDIICFGCNIVDEQGVAITNYFDTYKLEQTQMTGTSALNNMINHKNMWIYTGSAVYKSEMLIRYKLEYTQGCANGEDQEFTIKALSRAKTVSFIDKSLACYVQRAASISNSYNIKRFDAIAALERTYKYIEDLGNSELNIIYALLKNRHIVDNYIYNFDCCLDYIYKNSKLNSDSFKILYDDIEKAYPSSHSNVISSMKNYSGNKKVFFKVKLFLMAPSLYIWIFKLKNKIV